MQILRRLLLLVMLPAVPSALTWLSYVGVTALLAATNRVIDPNILQMAGIAEFAAFFFITALDVKARWTAAPRMDSASS